MKMDKAGMKLVKFSANLGTMRLDKAKDGYGNQKADDENANLGKTRPDKAKEESEAHDEEKVGKRKAEPPIKAKQPKKARIDPNLAKLPKKARIDPNLAKLPKKKARTDPDLDDLSNLRIPISFYSFQYEFMKNFTRENPGMKGALAAIRASRAALLMWETMSVAEKAQYKRAPAKTEEAQAKAEEPEVDDDNEGEDDD